MSDTIEMAAEDMTPAPEPPNVPAVQQTGGQMVSVAALQKMATSKHKDAFGAGELLLPWLSRVQGTSDYVKDNKPNYIAGAKPGDITDSLTLKLRSIQTVILCKYEIHYTTYTPGKNRKMLKQWFSDSSAYDAAHYPPGFDYGSKIDAEGNVVVDKPMYYALAVDVTTGAADPVCIDFSSTQVKKVRRINTLARADVFVPDERGVLMPITPPIYARLFDLTTRKESDDENQWIGWVADVGDLVLSNERYGEMWYAKAEAFREQIDQGNVHPIAQHADDDAHPAMVEGGGFVPKARPGPSVSHAHMDDDIPF